MEVLNDKASDMIFYFYISEVYMTKKEEFYLLLKLYNDGKYKIEDFCDELSRILFLENNGISEFKGKEKEYVSKLANVTERYSPYARDHIKFSGIYSTEKEVESAIEEFFRNISDLKNN